MRVSQQGILPYTLILFIFHYINSQKKAHLYKNLSQKSLRIAHCVYYINSQKKSTLIQTFISKKFENRTLCMCRIVEMESDGESNNYDFPDGI